MPRSEGVGLMPAKGRIAALLLLVTASGTAFALPRLLVRAQPRTQAERPPAGVSIDRGPVKVVRVSPFLVIATNSPSILSLSKHAQQNVVVTIPRRGPQSVLTGQGVVAEGTGGTSPVSFQPEPASSSGRPTAPAPAPS